MARVVRIGDCMKARLLPMDILLAHLDVHEYRAWSRCWTESLAGMFGHADSTLALKRFAALTFTPEQVVQDSRSVAGSIDEFLDAMAVRWAATQGREEHLRTWHLPEGVVGVEPPVNLDAVRRFILDWKAQQPALQRFVTGDLRMLTQLQIAVEHATGDEPVLIMGETGTGKGALARIIHELSGRTQFEAINCTAIPATLIESELFGHMRGAFTGAAKERKGLVEIVGNGTLFLDEVGDLAPEAQPKLLRLLREREYRRVGDHKVQATSARFIAATNAELAEKIAKDLYRQDLFQRLGGCRIILPPLRERAGDVDLLVAYLLEQLGHRAGLTESARSLLHRYEWPGNVAELADAVRYAVTAAHCRPIDVSDLPDDIVAATYPPRGTAAQVLLVAHAATEVTGDEARLPAVLSSILDEELTEPPVIGGDEEVDSLIQAIVGMAALVSKEAQKSGPRGVEDAVAQVRGAALLAELRHTASEAGYPGHIIEEIETRLSRLLDEVKGVPLLGIITEILINVLGSDDADARSKLHEFALKLKRSGPLVASAVLPALQKTMSHRAAAHVSGGSTTPALVPQPQVSKASGLSKMQGTDWKDPINRAAIEAALREAGGVKTRAAKLLGVGQPYFQTLVKLHDLGGLAAELRNQSRAARVHHTAEGKNGHE